MFTTKVLTFLYSLPDMWYSLCMQHNGQQVSLLESECDKIVHNIWNILTN